MSDSEKIETRYNYQFIHNVFGHFMQDTLDYFADYLYPRFENWKIISTYDKAIQYLNQLSAGDGHETDMPTKPALILNPSGDFDFDEAGGRQPWRNPNIAPGILKYLFEPIYKDQNIIITPGFSRIKGELEFMAILSSFYEYCDFKILLGLIFGGKDKFIYPQWFNSFIILPQEIYDYTYTNQYTGVSYKINISEIESRLIKTTNRNEVVFPCRILPRYRLTGISDGSEKYGGTEKLPEWKLNFTLEYEVEIPSFIVLESDYIVKDFKINMSYGSCYSSNSDYNSEDIPTNIFSFNGELTYYDPDSTSEIEIDLDSTSSVLIDYDGPDHTNITNKKELIFKTRYFHIVTKSEEDSETTIEFQMPEYITDKNLLVVQGKFGRLNYGDHFILSSDGWTITIYKRYVDLQREEILELFVYDWV